MTDTTNAPTHHHIIFDSDGDSVREWVTTGPVDSEEVLRNFPHGHRLKSELIADCKPTIDPLATHPLAWPADRDCGGYYVPFEPRDKSLQDKVKPWLHTCFGAKISSDRIERNHRFLEEALELVQSNDCTRDEAHQLVDYVFDRETGELQQEVGGVMVTLAALCLASGVNMHEAGDTELDRVWTKIDKIRAKQAAKPERSPLPQSHKKGGDLL